ncbi:hypothetical protein K493DRAFT_389014 [Basidiobolus meristosporus CBS 931.73]|uniref:Secreted protein n=1 Tax=Basidiobolus meristosporus CBS 931.73 TaxID=1314790 RepID=A0A1Y1X828_9FUNG|nr:hypothetical protein K493DRAFT_389014 [Basidiobolus meristosporus CBS 931.73]|eukprot:ORX81885.1 hypothetical protein K493DRAFT_389014 [Basidiobolus meristosporus CBS 931.73]
MRFSTVFCSLVMALLACMSTSAQSSGALLTKVTIMLWMFIHSPKPAWDVLALGSNTMAVKASQAGEVSRGSSIFLRIAGFPLNFATTSPFSIVSSCSPCVAENTSHTTRRTSMALSL